MDGRYKSYPGGIMKEKRCDFLSWADDVNGIPSKSMPDCVVIRTRLNDMDWIIVISETPNAIKTTALGFNTVSAGKNRGYILHRSLPKPKNSTTRY